MLKFQCRGYQSVVHGPVEVRGSGLGFRKVIFLSVCVCVWGGGGGIAMYIFIILKNNFIFNDITQYLFRSVKHKVLFFLGFSYSHENKVP
jgi:hypothetical protein